MKCVVPGCMKTIASARFHYFPVNNPHLCRTWLQCVRNPAYSAETELKVISQDRLMVCSEHFLPADYEGTCLKGDAVPSVFTWTQVQEQQETDEPITMEEDPDQQGVVIQAEDESCVLKSTEVLVNTECLLERFRSCSVCLIECCLNTEDHEKYFSVTQDCQSCGHHRVWCSQPNAGQKHQHQYQDTKSKDENRDIRVEAGARRREREQPESKDDSPTTEEEPDQQVVIVQAAEESSALKSTEVLVNTDCLLELFTSCSVCLIECCVDIKDHEKYFSVTQDCQSCGHHRVWCSQPNAAQKRQDQRKSGDDNHDRVAFYSKVKPAVKRPKQVARTASTCKRGRRSYKKTSGNVDGSSSCTNKNSSVPKKQEKKKRRKRKPKKKVSSEDLKPRLNEAASATSIDEELFKILKADDELKLVMWCTKCNSDASHSCLLHRHKSTFCCAKCGDGNDAKNNHFEKLAVRFEDLGSFQTHAEKEHGAKAIHKLCQECGKFVVADPESRGMKEHKCGPKSNHFNCPECGRRFPTQMGLKRHYSKLHENHEHPCKYCLMVFKDRPSKLDHEKSHPKEEQPYSCPDCSEKFDKINKRNGHLKSHGGRFKHACDTCWKSFKSVANLKKHKVIHFGEKPLQCQNLVAGPRRTKGKEMSMELKQAIVDLRNQKKSIRVIAKMLELSRSAVAYIIKKQARTGDLTNKKRSGRPKKTTAEDDQIILSIMTKNPRTTIRQIKNELMEAGRDVSATTIRRILHSLNHSIESAYLDKLELNNKPESVLHFRNASSLV